MDSIVYSFQDLNINCSSNETESENLPGAIAYTKMDICIVIAILLVHSLTTWNCKVKCFATIENFKKFEPFSLKTLSVITVLTILFISLPLLLLASAAAFAYRTICIQLIKRKDNEFIDVLNGFDAFWSLEEENSKSIINVAGTIAIASPQNFVRDLKMKLQKLHSKCIGKNKIFFRRREKYGFYYWRYCDPNFEEHVAIIDTDNKTVGLEELLSEHSEKSLPFSNEALFQVLITSLPINTDNAYEHGIIFRIHHSLGDGVSLINFLCQNITDEVQISASQQKLHIGKTSETGATVNDFLKMPVTFAEGILRKPDVNSIHGAKLTGSKVFAWTNCDNLLELIKDITISNTNSTFTSILTMALAKGLKFYFNENAMPVPAEVSVVLPIRFPKQHSSFANDFSVAILNIPVGPETNIQEFTQRYKSLKNSSDALTNNYLLKMLGDLPMQILKVLLISRHATLVLSNLPGPSSVSICGGQVGELVFFVPNKGYTGLGITALTYSGVTRLAACADRAVIPTSQHLRLILHAMTQEIQSLHREYCTK